jgi:hypothetical protein
MMNKFAAERGGGAHIAASCLYEHKREWLPGLKQQLVRGPKSCIKACSGYVQQKIWDVESLKQTWHAANVQLLIPAGGSGALVVNTRS